MSVDSSEKMENRRPESWSPIEIDGRFLSGQGGFLGREKELANLGASLAIDRGSTLLVSGERGVGKTSLVDAAIGNCRSGKGGQEKIVLRIPLVSDAKDETEYKHYMVQAIVHALDIAFRQQDRERLVFWHWIPLRRRIKEMTNLANSVQVSLTRTMNLGGLPDDALSLVKSSFNNKMELQLDISDARIELLLGSFFEKYKDTYKFIVVFDEMDKYYAEAVKNHVWKEYITPDKILRWHKNLFTVSNAHFIFITDQHYYRYLDAVIRSDNRGVESTLFTHRLLIQPMNPKDFKQLIARLHGRGYTLPVVFEHYIMWHTRLNPFDLYRTLLRLTEWSTNYSYDLRKAETMYMDRTAVADDDVRDGFGGQFGLGYFLEKRRLAHKVEMESRVPKLAVVLGMVTAIYLISLYHYFNEYRWMINDSDIQTAVVACAVLVLLLALQAIGHLAVWDKLYGRPNVLYCFFAVEFILLAIGYAGVAAVTGLDGMFHMDVNVGSRRIDISAWLVIYGGSTMMTMMMFIWAILPLMDSKLTYQHLASTAKKHIHKAGYRAGQKAAAIEMKRRGWPHYPRRHEIGERGVVLVDPRDIPRDYGAKLHEVMLKVYEEFGRQRSQEDVFQTRLYWFLRAVAAKEAKEELSEGEISLGQGGSKDDQVIFDEAGRELRKRIAKDKLA